MKYLLYYFIFINILGLLSMYVDKIKAKKNKWRISESKLLTIAVIGGSLGSYLGMTKFRHKTKHLKFKFGLPVIIIAQIAIIFTVMRYLN